MGLRFPRLNNISFWRALLWILIGCFMIMCYLSMTQSFDTLLLGTMVVAIPYKLNDLPNTKMDRGPEHVIKAMNGYREMIHESLQSTILQDSLIIACGASENPVGTNSADITVSPLSGQSRDGATTFTLRSFLAVIKQCNGSNKYNAYKESTTGFPKGSNPYGDGVPILVTMKRVHLGYEVGQRTFSTSTVTAQASPDYISGSDLNLKLKVRNGKYYGLFKLVSKPDILYDAYHSIQSKAGKMRPDTDNESLRGLSPELFHKLSVELRSESFSFKSTRRIFTPKPLGKRRPLGIPSPLYGLDLIVQKAMEILLSLIYEPVFLDSNHGFRPNRSCHSALKEISK